MQRLAKDVEADENMLRFAVINGLNPVIRNHVTWAQPTTWTDLVYHAKVGEMCVPVAPPTDPTLSAKLAAIQDQLDQLTKVRSVSPVCVAGRSESQRESSCSDSHPGSPKRVRFDLCPAVQTKESRTTGIHKTTSVMIVVHVPRNASLTTTGTTRGNPSNGMPDPQITNLGVETDLVAPKGASFCNDRDL